MASLYFILSIILVQDGLGHDCVSMKLAQNLLAVLSIGYCTGSRKAAQVLN
jgi:hypothetical protein